MSDFGMMWATLYWNVFGVLAFALLGLSLIAIALYLIKKIINNI